MKHAYFNTYVQRPGVSFGRDGTEPAECRDGGPDRPRSVHRSLRDLGLCRSELDSRWTEARGEVERTRLRLAS